MKAHALEHTDAGWLTGWQWSFLGLQFLGLVLVVFYMNGTQPEAFRLLYQDPTGVKMLGFAAGLLLVNVLAYSIGSIILNRTLGRNWPDNIVPYSLLSVGLHVVCFFFLYLPMIWVLSIGPSALLIRQNLMM